MRSHGIKGSPHLAPGVLVSGGDTDPERHGKRDAQAGAGRVGAEGPRLRPAWPLPASESTSVVSSLPTCGALCSSHRALHGHPTVTRPSVDICLSVPPSPICPARRTLRGHPAGGEREDGRLGAERPVSLSTLLGAARFGYEVHVLLTT